jgi:hypothetical protein
MEITFLNLKKFKTYISTTTYLVCMAQVSSKYVIIYTKKTNVRSSISFSSFLKPRFLYFCVAQNSQCFDLKLSRCVYNTNIDMYPHPKTFF